MRVSVAMATYNGGAYIAAQLMSIIAQERPPDELIVCDDQSTDHTLDIVSDLARGAPFEVVLHRNAERLGYSRNFEKALRAAGGDVIFFSDQDDAWDPQRIAAIIVDLDQHAACQLIVNDMRIADEQMVVSDQTMLGFLQGNGLGERFLVHGCATAIRRSWRDFVLPIPHERWTYDVWMHDLGRRLGVRHVHQQALQTYRRHGSNASGLPERSHASGLGRLYLTLSGKAEDSFLSQRPRLQDLKARMTREVSGASGVAAADAVSSAFQALNLRLDAIARRDQLLSAPHPRRLRQAWQLLRGGGYTEFSGLSSFIKDVLLGRPR